MDGLEITTNGSYVKIIYNDFAGNPSVDMKKNAYKREDVDEFILGNSDQVYCKMKDGRQWQLSHTLAPDCFLVKTINGVAPTSQDDLFDKLLTVFP